MEKIEEQTKFLEAKKIRKKKFEDFLKDLSDEYEVYVPAGKNELISFERFPLEEGEIFVKYTRTMLPAKKILFPNDMVLMEIKEEKVEEKLPEKKIAIVGLHLCDINALKIVDAMLSREYPDSYYLKVRENSILIGVECIPDDKCFCLSMRTNRVENGFDLFFLDGDEEYY
ncbi:MAG: hypothetical protein DRO52_04325, partial [Candidatus Hecatellales archaeon]